jgi:hypothetical protein
MMLTMAVVKTDFVRIIPCSPDYPDRTRLQMRRFSPNQEAPAALTKARRPEPSAVRGYLGMRGAARRTRCAPKLFQRG